MTHDDTLKRAAEFLRNPEPRDQNGTAAALDALREELARQEPVAWRHSNTHSLHDSEDDVYLADGDSFAEPLYTTPQPAQVPEGWRRAVALAYGHLWHVNNEPLAPVPLRSNETAAYAARKLLRDLLTDVERGLAINEVQTMLVAALHPKEKS